ncbi:hypothetical protein HK097_006283, partial [Rhizophlyctis rosea]
QTPSNASHTSPTPPVPSRKVRPITISHVPQNMRPPRTMENDEFPTSWRCWKDVVAWAKERKRPTFMYRGRIMLDHILMDAAQRRDPHKNYESPIQDMEKLPVSEQLCNTFRQKGYLLFGWVEGQFGSESWGQIVNYLEREFGCEAHKDWNTVERVGNTSVLMHTDSVAHARSLLCHRIVVKNLDEEDVILKVGTFHRAVEKNWDGGKDPEGQNSLGQEIFLERGIRFNPRTTLFRKGIRLHMGLRTHLERLGRELGWSKATSVEDDN